MGEDGVRAAAIDRHQGPRERHAGRRAQLPRRREHRAVGAPERDVCADTHRSRATSHSSRSRVGSGIELLSQAAARGIGISEFVSVGNKSDVSGNDLLQYWEDDPRTDVILLYLESFGNPRKFARIARRISRRKPIVAVKSGRTPAGSRAASSHTAALASSDVAVDALFRQAGRDPRRHARGAARHRADAGVAADPGRARVSRSSATPAVRASWPPTRAPAPGSAVEELSAAHAGPLAVGRRAADRRCRNPIDLGAAATPELFAHALPVVLARRRGRRGDRDLRAAGRHRRGGGRAGRSPTRPPRPRPASRSSRASSVGSTLPTSSAATARARRTIPTFAFPEAAARALGRAAELAAWRARPDGRGARARRRRRADAGRRTPRSPAPARRGAHEAAARGSTRLDSRRAAPRTSASRRWTSHGVCRRRHGASPRPASSGTRSCSRSDRREVVHKTDVGGVALGLDSRDAVQRAFDEMHARFGDAMDGAVVQRMAPPGLEVIVGVTQDPLFGPLLLFGLGGVTAELLADRALRILPRHRRGRARARSVAAHLAVALRLPRLARTRRRRARRPDPARRAARAGRARDHRDGPQPGHRARARRRRRRREGALRAGTRLVPPELRRMRD